MAVSKRTRFEVLRRDGFTCHYCGSGAPDVKLTVDHVVPVALGGSDDPSNLVAACKDCNAGKTSTSPDEVTVAAVAADAARWAAAIKEAAGRQHIADAMQLLRLSDFEAAWQQWDNGLAYLPADWRRSVAGWLDSGLRMEELIESLNIALLNRNVTHSGVFAYTGGIARNRIKKLHEAARALLDQGEGAKSE